MTASRPRIREPDPTERPTGAAHIRIETEGARVKIIARRWITAEGTVPSRDARYLITMFGVLSSVVTGTAGAVLTLRIAGQLAPVAFAELVLALIGAVLIVVDGHVLYRAPGEEQAPDDTVKPIGPKSD